MKPLNVEARVGTGARGRRRSSRLKGYRQEKAYAEFSAAIGLIGGGEKWQPWHRQQIRDILNLVAATEEKAGSNTGAEALQFERIITADEGKPGAGFYKTSQIVTK